MSKNIDINKILTDAASNSLMSTEVDDRGITVGDIDVFVSTRLTLDGMTGRVQILGVGGHGLSPSNAARLAINLAEAARIAEFVENALVNAGVAITN
jgi:hypothetical protein